MKTFLKPLAVAALLAVGTCAHATLYDWSYTASFTYTPDGSTNYTTTTGTLTGQLNGTAATRLSQAGVDFESFVSLSFTDGLGHTVNLLDRGALADGGPGSDFLATSSQTFTHFSSYDAGGQNGIEAMNINQFDLFYTASGAGVTQNWLGDLSTGTWSLAEHTSTPSAVPEPTTALLALLGVPAVAWRTRRRAAAKAAA